MSLNSNNLIERLKSKLSIKKDKDLCLLLDIKSNTLSTWRKRDTLDFNKILELCEKHNLDLNYIFFEEDEKIKPEEEPKEEFKRPAKSRVNHFLSTQLINTNRNICVFYNQIGGNDGNDNSSGEIIIGQKVSVKKIDENSLYIIEDKDNALYLDKLVLIKNKNNKTSRVYLNRFNKNIELKSIVNVWGVLDVSSNFFKYMDGLGPL